MFSSEPEPCILQLLPASEYGKYNMAVALMSGDKQHLGFPIFDSKWL